MTHRRPVTKKRATDPGIVAARAMAWKLDPDPAHAVQVCRLALALFDQTTSLHGLDDRERRLLHAAALLHDIGHSISELGHHKHARDLILDSKLDDFTGKERQMIACIARYHRKAHPRADHKVYAALAAPRQERVRKLAAILRVADGLDRAHQASVRKINVTKEGDTVRIVATQRHPNSVDIWGPMRKRGLFEEVFGVAVEVVAANTNLAGQGGDE
ncbi:MAG: hypothetical protein AMXMBFR4_05220 [Candidatus Hydrogenedentota bacterium]